MKLEAKVGVEHTEAACVKYHSLDQGKVGKMSVNFIYLNMW